MDDRMRLVGRDGELAEVSAAIDAAVRGRGSALAFVGDPGIGKSSLLAAVATRAREAGLSPGAVVVLDDAHRLPPDRLEGVLRRDGLLVALAYRPRQLPPAVAAVLFRAVSTATLRLHRLGPLSLADARAILGDRPDLDRLHTDSEGVPLYLRLVADPATEYAGALLAELAELSPTQTRAARLAAALGGPFAPDLVVAVSTMERDTVLSALDSLVAADIIRAAETGPLLAFRHPVVARVVYQTTPLSQRHALHGRIDRTLANRGASAAERARHALGASAASGADTAGAGHVSTLLRAARETMAQDPRTAAGWLESARTLLPAGDPSRDTVDQLLAQAWFLDGRLTDSREVLLGMSTSDAAVLRGRIERLLGQYPEATALMLREMSENPRVADRERAALLLELAEIAGDRGEFADADRHASAAADLARRLSDPPVEASALAEAAWSRGCAGDVVRAGAALDVAADILDSMSDRRAVADLECLRRVGQAEMLLERMPAARHHLARGVRLARRTGQSHVLPPLLKALAEVELRLGRLTTGLDLADEAERGAQRAGMVATAVIVASLRVYGLLWLRPVDAVDECLAVAERAIALRETRDGWWNWMNGVQLAYGTALLQAGQLDRCEQTLLDAAGGPLLPRVAPLRRVRWWETLTAAAIGKGDLAVARRFAALAEDSVQTSPTPGRRGNAHRARALVLRGEPEAALVAATAAIAAFTQAGLAIDEGQSHLIAADALDAAGRVDEAATHRCTAAEIARRTRSARLADLVVVVPPVPLSVDWRRGLTRREAEVAELAGAALTSNEIAARLHLSVRTVDSHLGRVYRKLGVANRTSLASIVATHR